MAFIHVQDADDALLAAAAQSQSAWEIFNAAPDVATIGQLARVVQKLAQQHGAWVRINGAASSEADFRVRSKLDFTPRRTLASGLSDVLDYFFNL
jgi:nucleoside-diphosphate-sugar epimerase